MFNLLDSNKVSGNLSFLKSFLMKLFLFSKMPLNLNFSFILLLSQKIFTFDKKRMKNFKYHLLQQHCYFRSNMIFSKLLSPSSPPKLVFSPFSPSPFLVFSHCCHIISFKTCFSSFSPSFLALGQFTSFLKIKKKKSIHDLLWFRHFS